MPGLTPKREAFALAVASGKNHGEAYRLAFDAGNMKAETIRKRASELACNGDVKGRIEELRAPIAEKAQITLESHLRDLLKLRNQAAKEKQTGRGGGPVTLARVELVAMDDKRKG